MIQIIDTCAQIPSLFEDGCFSLEKWEAYINAIYAQSANRFKKDLKRMLDSDSYTYEKDILPILHAVPGHPALENLQRLFRWVTAGLNERIANGFGRVVDVDIVLYMGLCNAAGWVTHINNRDVILLGVEKILELGWDDTDSLYGLIYHELGHVYHNQHGKLKQHSNDSSRNFVWQLFTEGVAMYFEQVLVNDLAYYHQNKNGWQTWCEEHFRKILADFHTDLLTMTPHNQRYFGDWVKYNGRSDVGYYLGARFVQHLCERYRFEQLIQMHLEDVYQEYLVYVEKENKQFGTKGPLV